VGKPSIAARIVVVHDADLLQEVARVVAAALDELRLRRIEPLAGPVTQGALRADQGVEHAAKRLGLRVTLGIRSDL